MNKIKSLTLKLICMIFISAAIAGCVFFAVYYSADIFLNANFQKSNYKSEVQKYADDLQKYVVSNNLSSDDEDSIYKWTKKGKFVYLILYENGRMIFDSLSELDNEYELRENEWTEYYNIEFRDGIAQAFILVVPGYKYYIFMIIAGVILSVIVFLSVFIYWVNKEIGYIKELQGDVKLIEAGTLNKSITIRGVDELSDLAYGLEQMRLSMIENTETERKLTLANQNLVTGMSHDLRTPLTSLLMYLEILRSNNQLDNKNLYYLDKSYNKAMQIKELSDQLFEFFLVTKENSGKNENPQKIKSVFLDYLSETAMLLSKNGFRVQTDLEWQDVEIAVRYDYIGRIIDNITSNIIKYADIDFPVVISTAYNEKMAGIKFCNIIKSDCETIESTKVGVTNIRLMMDKMGDCVIKETGGKYETELMFEIIYKS